MGVVLTFFSNFFPAIHYLILGGTGKGLFQNP